MATRGVKKGVATRKGVPNIKTQHLDAMARTLQIDPFKILLYFAAGDWRKLGYQAEKILKQFGENVTEEYTISPELRVSAAAKACEYLHPKRKAIEINVGQETVTHITRTILTKKVD